jgi:hypothetical protein
MVSERACLDILRTMRGRRVILMQTLLPGTPDEFSSTCTEDHSVDESDLFRRLLPRYDL